MKRTNRMKRRLVSAIEAWKGRQGRLGGAAGPHRPWQEVRPEWLSAHRMCLAVRCWSSGLCNMS